MRSPNPDHICGLCDEFNVDKAAPEYAQLGMGLCQVAEPGRPLVHVAWDCRACISFRMDLPNLRRRRQFVDAQHRRHAAIESVVEKNM